MLGEKIEADEADASMPKSALVTIVNPAQPGQSQNLWQRLTGQVESQARIEIQPDITSSGNAMVLGPIAYASYDPYFLETELKSIQSDAVLGKAVDALKLDQGEGAELSRNDAIARLRSQLDVQSDRNTKDVEIGAKSDKPDEAANIANAVVEAYRQYRLEVHSNEMASGIEKLRQKYAEEGGEIRQLRTQLQQMETPGIAGAKAAMQTPVSVNKGDILRPPQPNAPIPQPEILTSDNAFSTFSLNVSDVSFKLAMASLEKGQMPAPASIRSEEFINAFDYHDPEPLQGEPLAFASERARDPFAQERDFLRFSIKAAAVGRQEGRALNLVLLLDTSGSMERADRVAIIREALRVLSAQLQPQDTVSVVTFARTARLWADGIPGDQAGTTLDKVGGITPDGGTNLEEAMRLAYETALRHFIAGGMNRVVLLTDGAANLGDVDPQALTQKVDAERRQGIALDCFGIGWDDYNDDLLEQLSSNGDGRYAFINSPDEAATEFAAKLAGALQVAAEDVKVQVEFNPNRVAAWRQIGYAKHQLTKQQFRDNTVAAGAIASREAGNALYVIETRPDGEGPIATVRVRYRVPGTQDVRERSWLVDYTGPAPELAQSGPAMRLVATAAEISEWLADSPFAQDVTPDELLNYLNGVPQFYGTDKRPEQLEWLIREVKSVGGR
jgi:secreted protein with Ig-like and vWFA domain